MDGLINNTGGRLGSAPYASVATYTDVSVLGKKARRHVHRWRIATMLSSLTMTKASSRYHDTASPLFIAVAN